jgi:hypothetical protein
VQGQVNRHAVHDEAHKGLVDPVWGRGVVFDGRLPGHAVTGLDFDEQIHRLYAMSTESQSRALEEDNLPGSSVICVTATTTKPLAFLACDGETTFFCGNMDELAARFRSISIQ